VEVQALQRFNPPIVTDGPRDPLNQLLSVGLRTLRLVCFRLGTSRIHMLSSPAAPISMVLLAYSRLGGLEGEALQKELFSGAAAPATPADELANSIIDWYVAGLYNDSPQSCYQPTLLRAYNFCKAKGGKFRLRRVATRDVGRQGRP
jgi:hypothetical protein